MFEQLGLIGCGLMGGSFALAAKRASASQVEKLRDLLDAIESATQSDDDADPSP